MSLKPDDGIDLHLIGLYFTSLRPQTAYYAAARRGIKQCGDSSLSVCLTVRMSVSLSYAPSMG